MKKLLTLLAATTTLTACHHEDTNKAPAMTEEQVRLIIDNYIEENPEKIMLEMNNYVMKMQAEQSKQAMQALSEFDELTPVMGPMDAPITIIEFSDFECPFCEKVTPTISEIMERYKGKVKIAYKHLPLNFHQNAKPAAYASIAAHKQGKFWEFHDELFKNVRNLNERTYLRIAKKLNLDEAQFKADMKNPEVIAKVEKDLQQASSMNISGTPYFLINGVAINGAHPTAEFVRVIEEQLDTINK